MSSAGQACDSACSNVKKQCSPKHLILLNDCDRLRDNIGCEAGCEAGKVDQEDVAVMPLYVAEDAPKPRRPAMCFTAPTSSALTCSAKSALAKRLCACV